MMRPMKDSGIEWIGKIPEGWRAIKFKYFYIHKKEIAGDRADDYERLALTLNGVIKRPKDDSEGLQPGQFDGYQILQEDDFVFKMIDLQNISTSRVGLSAYKGLVSPAYIRFSSKGVPHSRRFFYYFLMSLYYNCVYNNLGGDGVRSALNANDLGDLIFPIPPLAEQQAIADYLDEKCAAIDKLIDNQKVQIEKMKEYKQSVITEAVTKGLTPSVPMKDSGIAWIGKIPEGWETCRLKNVADPLQENSFIDGDWIESPDITDEGIRYLTTGNVGDGLYKRQGNGYISQETFKDLNCKYAYPGDLVIARLNAPYGRSCILEDDEDSYVLAVDIVILRTLQDKRYICYFTQCPGYQRAVEDYSRGTAMKRISRNNLGNIDVLLPPLAEQQAIADYLDEKCAAIDKLIAVKQAKIDKLNDYKKSLIYEYVTGKREVL